MTLSSTTQAVLDSWCRAHGWEADIQPGVMHGLSEAFRAAVDEILPVEYELVDDNLQYEKRNPIREEFLTIVRELEKDNV